MEFPGFQRLQPQLLALLRIVVALLFLQHALRNSSAFPTRRRAGPAGLPSLFAAAGWSK